MSIAIPFGVNRKSLSLILIGNGRSIGSDPRAMRSGARHLFIQSAKQVWTKGQNKLSSSFASSLLPLILDI
jgi:hypothetical protein